MGFFEIIEKIFNMFQHTEERIEKFMQRLEQKIEMKILGFKKKLFRSVFELMFFMISILLIVSGTVLFFTRFFPVDVVLFIGGGVSLYIALMLNWMK